MSAWGRPEWVEAILADNVAIEADSTAVTDVVDCEKFSEMRLTVSSTGSLDVYVKHGVSDDRMGFATAGDDVQTEDEARVWNVDNTTKSWRITGPFKLVQVVLDEKSGAANTVYAALNGA